MINFCTYIINRTEGLTNPQLVAWGMMNCFKQVNDRQVTIYFMFTQAITAIGKQKAIEESIKLYGEEMDKVSFNSPRRSLVELMHTPGAGVRT